MCVSTKIMFLMQFPPFEEIPRALVPTLLVLLPSRQACFMSQSAIRKAEAANMWV